MWILLIVILLKINGEIVDYHNIDDASISSGIEHTCAIHFLTNTDFGGQVNCWGSNSYGQCNAPKVSSPKWVEIEVIDVGDFYSIEFGTISYVWH